jgi:hypothetical protein
MTCIKTFSMYESKHFLIAIVLPKVFQRSFSSNGIYENTFEDDIEK